jgi:hypothetical protein
LVAFLIWLFFVAGATETSSDTGSKRKCKYKIPYIGRTVSVPCRD